MTFKVKMYPTKQTLIQFQKCQAEFDATSVVLTFSKSAWKQKKQHTPLNTEIITFVSSASVGVSTTAKMLWSLEPSSIPAMGRWMNKAQNCDYNFKNDDDADQSSKLWWRFQKWWRCWWLWWWRRIPLKLEGSQVLGNSTNCSNLPIALL